MHHGGGLRLLTILTDNYPGEITWDLADSTGAIVASGGPYVDPETLPVENFCAGEGCYTLTMYDSFGDGICCAYGAGNYDLTIDGTWPLEAITERPNPRLSVSVKALAAPMPPRAIMTWMRTGSCDFSCYGCTDPESCNYDAEATIDDGSCIGDGVAVTISVTTDTWPGETTWTLSDSIGEVVLSGGPYTTNGITDEQLICVGDGCYTFSIADSFGDGIFDPVGTP